MQPSPAELIDYVGCGRTGQAAFAQPLTLTEHLSRGTGKDGESFVQYGDMVGQFGDFIHVIRHDENCQALLLAQAT